MHSTADEETEAAAEADAAAARAGRPAGREDPDASGTPGGERPREAAGAEQPPPGAEPADGPPPDEPTPAGWPLYEAYVRHFATSDGRIVDVGHDGRSTSESQAYGLFHALVAGDQATFERVLTWADHNLAGGKLGQQLPAWHWGENGEGEWTVLDGNAASDADLWMAYALGEASRLWGEPRYGELSGQLLDLIREQEWVELPGAGPMMLPGPHGFVLSKTRWRLNPSYLPVPLLRWAHRQRPEHGWGPMVDVTVAMLRDVTPHGLVADWVAYDAKTGWTKDPVSGDKGSFDAIRTYLWAGATHDDDPVKSVLGSRLAGLARAWRDGRDVPPSVKPWGGGFGDGRAPVGFLAALLPTVDEWADPSLGMRLRQDIRLHRVGDLYGHSPDYYDHNLLLFGLGFAEGRYAFAADGSLTVPWASP